MPQPRQTTARRDRPTPPQQQAPEQPSSAGSAAALAALGALAATQAPTPGLPNVTPAVREATAALLSATDSLFRKRRGEMATYVRHVVESEMPEAPQSRVDQLVQEEQRRELEFQRKLRARLQAELPLALAESNPEARRARVTQIMEREKRYLGQRQSASAYRVVAALEQDLLKQISPEGAYWQLSPLVKEHTLDCLAMGGKFWPWQVLEDMHPQLHPGCMCRLLGLQEAKSAGLMTDEQVPDSADAVARAQQLADEAKRLQEQMDPEQLEAIVDELETIRITEARERVPLRWMAGSVKGGEFRPVRGGDRGALSKVAKQLSLGDMGRRAEAGASREVTIRGQRRSIPESTHWDERIGGVRYTSPAGGTSLYREGTLIGSDHPDLMEPGGAQYSGDPAAAPSKLSQPNAAIGNTPDAPVISSAEPDSIREPVLGIPDYTGTDLKLADRAGGSTGARFARDTNGDRWLVKDYGGNNDRIATELLANAIYREMGAPAAEAGTIQLKAEEPDFSKAPTVKLDNEPPLPKLGKGRRMSTGVIVRDPDGSLWVYEPKGHFGGYEHTFPKGGLEKGLTPQQNALKELWEETGLHAAITDYVGDFEGDTGTSRYYLATRTGGEPHPADPTPYVKGGSETAAVKRLTPEAAREALNKPRDKQILDAVLKLPIPEGGKPDEFPPYPEGLALTYPTLDGTVREKDWKRPGVDPWGGPSAKLGEHYMTDALLANWDFVGLSRDNVLWRPDPADPGGEEMPVRLDQGGTFQFRAQGQPKPYGPIPTEVWTMRQPKGQGFGTVQVTESQMRDQARQIGERLTDDRIDAIVNQAPFDDKVMRDEVRQSLKDRVQWMRDFADGETDLPRPLDGLAARKQLKQDQAKLDVYPEEHTALDYFARGGWQDVNSHLRSGAGKDKASDEVKNAVSNLDELLKVAKVDDDVYGYVPYDPETVNGGKGVEGRVLRDAGFATATTRRSRVSKAKGILRVTIPAGSRAVYVQGLEGLEDVPPAVELVMPRGARMQVVGVQDEDGQQVADAVVLP